MTQTGLPEHLPSCLTRDEAISIGVPSAEDLVVVLLLLTREGPGDFGRFDRWVLEEALEGLGEGLLLRSGVELGCTRRSEGLLTSSAMFCDVRG